MPGAVAIWPDVTAPTGDYGGPLLGSWWMRPGGAAGVELVPNAWDDRNAVAAAEQRVWEACIRLAPLLADALGGHDRDWWRWVVSPWLICAASVIEDARSFLAAAAAAAPGVPAVAFERRTPPPATMPVSLAELRSVDHHRVLVGAVAAQMGMATRPAEAADEARVVPDAPEAAGARHRQLDQRLREVISALLLERGGSVSVIGQSGMTGPQALALRRASRARVVAARHAVQHPPGPSEECRSALKAASMEGDDLAALVSRLFPALVPRSLLEGRDRLPDLARATYGRPGHVLVGNYGADDAMNAHIAECAAAGYSVDHAQHGGFYLQARVNAQERLEIREGSTFLGWRDTPDPRLERLRGTHAGGDAVVVVEALNPPDPFVIRFASTPLANQAYESAELLGRLAGAAGGLPLTLRRFPRAGAVRPEALEALPPAPGASAVDAMRSARVAVLAYPDTPFVEAMVLGVPTIGLWNPSHWELREDAEPAFAALREAGVVFASPEEAATQLAAVYERADEWWAGGEVAAARAAFLDRFAPAGDWLAAWTAHLKDMRGRAEVSARPPTG